MMIVQPGDGESIAHLLGFFECDERLAQDCTVAKAALGRTRTIAGGPVAGGFMQRVEQAIAQMPGDCRVPVARSL